MRYQQHGFVDKHLLKMCEAFAKLICKQFGLKYRSIRLFCHNDPERLTTKGQCWPDGEIELEFRGKDMKRFSSISDILDTVVHELAHLQEKGHGNRFKALHKEMKEWAWSHLVNPE